MFNTDFYPTPAHVIEQMLSSESLEGKSVLEPSAGKGDIVDYLLQSGANVIACEKEKELVKILAHKCRVINYDFLQVSSEDISHVNYIVMNPPFSADENHILHAYEIAPAGCKIIALCNAETVKNPYQSSRKRLANLIEENGDSKNLGNCFSGAERSTGVEIALVRLQKPGGGYEAEFDGFFLEDEPEQEQANGMMSYNFVQDVVNRYIAAIKLYDSQYTLTQQMTALLNGSFNSKLEFKSTNDKGYPVTRSEFKKDLQKQAWKFIIDKFNLRKYATRGLNEDINKFVEQQSEVPFTMRNIYRMVEIIIGTAGQRMDKAIVEVFDKLTQRYHENRYSLPGWKTNSHYLVNQKFILDGLCYQDQRWYKGQSRIEMSYSSCDTIQDLLKALCYITGEKYEKFMSLYQAVRYAYRLYDLKGKLVAWESNNLDADRKKRELSSRGIETRMQHEQPSYGEWFDWGFFEVKAFKKGTMHFKFKDADVWGKFNQRVAQIKGYPLPENIHKKAA